MKSKVYTISLLLSLFVICGVSSNSHSAPSFSYIELLSVWNGTTWNLSTDLQLLNASSPAVSVEVDGTTYSMPFVSGIGYQSSVFPNSPSLYNGHTFTYNVNDGSNSLFATLSPIDQIRKVPQSYDFSITGDPYHPTVSWRNSDPDPDLDKFRVRLLSSTGSILVTYDIFDTTRDVLHQYTIPYDLIPGTQYTIRVEAIDRDNLTSDGLFLVYNRSNKGQSYTAPVPEPATLLLLGAGLIGLAGYGRKKI